MNPIVTETFSIVLLLFFFTDPNIEKKRFQGLAPGPFLVYEFPCQQSCSGTVFTLTLQ
jgi:hypothetical protein